MKFIAPLLVISSLVCLTAPDGFAVWLQKDQIVSILHPVSGDCAQGAKTKVTLGNGTTVCVQEERRDIVKKVQEGDGAAK